MLSSLRVSKGFLRAAAAGQADTGLASVATFLVQAYAASRLSGDLLGAYSLLFSASLLAAQVPGSFVFAPAQVLAARRHTDRLGGLFSMIRLGSLVSLPMALLSAVGAIPAIGKVDGRQLLILVVGAISFSFLTPIQDHLRAMLHVADQSTQAARVSLVYLAATIAVGSALHFVDPIWVPFGALVSANLLSTIYGLSSGGTQGAGVPFSWLELRRLGSWLFASGATNHGATFLSALVLERFLGLRAVGVLEAVRVIARPVQVAALGLNAVFAPRILQAVHQRDAVRSHRLRWGFWGGSAALSLAYLGLAGFEWSLNPMVYMIPLAFEFNGLAAASIFATLLTTLAAPLVSESLAGDRPRALFAVSVVGGGAQVLASFWAYSIGVYAGPIALAVAGFIRAGLLLRSSRNVIAES